MADPAGNIYQVTPFNTCPYPCSTNFDITVSKLDPAGTAVWSITFGGSSLEEASDVAFDSQGNFYVLGGTNSADFPVTPSAYNYQCLSYPMGWSCATFLTKISPDGKILYNAKLPAGRAVAIDSQGNAVIVGEAEAGVPTINAFQPATQPGNTTYTYRSAFIEKLDSSGSNLLNATYFGTMGAFATAVAIDAQDNIYVAGASTSDNFPHKNSIQQGPGSFIAKFNSQLDTLFFSTTIGGLIQDLPRSMAQLDQANAIAVDNSGHLYLVGQTFSPYFPVTEGPPPVCDAVPPNDCLGQGYFVKLAADGSSLLFATTMQWGAATQVLVDPYGNIYVAGHTAIDSIPLVNPVEEYQNGYDTYVREFDPSGKVLFSTYVGSSANDFVSQISLDAQQNLYVWGTTANTDIATDDFPVIGEDSSGSGQFLVRISNVQEPVLSLAPLSRYGALDQYVPKVMTVRNVGSAPLSISSIVSRAGVHFFTDCGSSLAPGKKCFFANPNSPASQFTITTNSAINGTVSFFALAPPPILLVSPRMLQFPLTNIGETSAPQTVAYSNPSALDVDLTWVDMNEFPVVSGTCGSHISAGSSCARQYAFRPSTAGFRQAGTYYGQTQNLYLQGTGNTDKIAASINSISFGTQYAFQSSLARLVTLTNQSHTSLNITGITTSGDFAQTNDCPSALPADTICNVWVRFTPSTTGFRVGQLSVASVGMSTPAVVQLNGTGDIPSDLRPSTYSLGQLGFHSPLGFPSSIGSVTLTNNGSSPLAITQFALPSEFSQTNNCSTLAPETSCTVNVSFVPTSAGDHAAILKVYHTGFGSPQYVNVLGTGVPGLDVNTTALTFDSALVGQTSRQTQFVILDNLTPQSQSPSITTTGDFIYAGTDCPLVMPATVNGAGLACAVYVNFRPTAIGMRTGSLVIRSATYPWTTSVALSGTATDISVTPSRPGRTGRPIISTSPAPSSGLGAQVRKSSTNSSPSEEGINAASAVEPSVFSADQELQLTADGEMTFSSGRHGVFRVYTAQNGNSATVTYGRFHNVRDAEQQINKWLSIAQKITSKRQTKDANGRIAGERIVATSQSAKSGQREVMIIRRDGLGLFLIESPTLEIALQAEEFTNVPH